MKRKFEKFKKKNIRTLKCPRKGQKMLEDCPLSEEVQKCQKMNPASENVREWVQNVKKCEVYKCHNIFTNYKNIRKFSQIKKMSENFHE